MALAIFLEVLGGMAVSVADSVDDAWLAPRVTAEEEEEAACDRELFGDERFFADLSWVMPGSHAWTSEHFWRLEGTTRDCEAGVMGGDVGQLGGQPFRAEVWIVSILERLIGAEAMAFEEEGEALVEAIQDLQKLWGHERGTFFICVPQACTPEKAAWRYFWEHVLKAPNTFEMSARSPREGELALSCQEASVGGEFDHLESKAYCRIFDHFNALNLFSLRPREDPAFLQSVPTLTECFSLIENTPTFVGLRIYAWARLGDTDPLCIGGTLTDLKDMSVEHRFRQISARPSDWVPQRGAVTIACAADDERTLLALLNAKVPCEDLYSEWECCRNSRACNGQGLVVKVQDLTEDIRVLEDRLVQLRRPRVWELYWELGRLYDLLALALAGEDSMRASSQAARWMELAIQLQARWDAMHDWYSQHQRRHLQQLYGNQALFQVLTTRLLDRSVDLRASRDSVKILLTVFGAYGVHCRATLLSILVHTSVSVAVFIAGDAAGIADARAVLADLKPGPDIVLAHLEFCDLSTNVAFQAAWSHLPPQLRQKGDFRPISGLSRLFTDEYLPDWVDNIIYMDIGDILVLEDISELWSMLEQFAPSQFIGLAGMPFQLKEYLRLQELLNVTMVFDQRGFNNGVFLLNLERARKAGFRSSLIRTMWSLAESIPEQKFGKMRIMDMMNLHIGLQPEILFELPCTWNYMPKAVGLEGDWGAQANWGPRVWKLMMSHPGLLSASSMEHHCPGVAWSFAAFAQHAHEAQLLRAVGPSGSQLKGCRCGERVRLLHAAGRIKNQPWVSLLLSEWGVPFDENTFSTAAWKRERGPGAVH